MLAPFAEWPRPPRQATTKARRGYAKNGKQCACLVTGDEALSEISMWQGTTRAPGELRQRGASYADTRTCLRKALPHPGPRPDPRPPPWTVAHVGGTYDADATDWSGA